MDIYTYIETYFLTISTFTVAYLAGGVNYTDCINAVE